MNEPAVGSAELRPSPLHADLVAMLRATREAERDLFGMLSAPTRDGRGNDGGWSAKDVQAHLAAWRSIEARRLEATTMGESDGQARDPAPNDPIDESNAELHAQSLDLSWDAVDSEADASVGALIAAIGRSSTDVLCECDGTVAGIGANGANHAISHLSDIARLSGGMERFDMFTGEIEAILSRGHLPPRDSGVMLYNIGCHHALSGHLDEARRLLRAAFSRRRDLLEPAREDPDLLALGEELAALAKPG